MEDVIGLTKRLVQIESTNPGTGEREAAAYICRYLSESQAAVIRDETVNGRCNLIAEIPAEQGMGERALVLICHMDTVVVGDGWTKDPFGAEEINGRIYGRGSCDMKSGLACALSAFKKTALEVRAGKRRLSRPLRLICTVDEEGDMAGVEHVVRKGYVTAEDLVLDLEPTDGQIQMAHKGRLWIRLDIQGVTAHASRPEQGADAVAAAAEMIVGIREGFEAFPIHAEMGKSTVTFGQIQGGYQPYVVPNRCRVWMDCRLAPPIDTEKVVELIQETSRSVRRRSAGIHVRYQITGERPYIEENRESWLLRELQRATRAVCGRGADVSVFPGYTDTAVVAGMLGNAECMSYGPGDLAYAHKPDESVACRDIERCERVLLELIGSLC